MPFEALFMPFSIAAFVYMVLALQLLGGFPPFYRQLGGIPAEVIKNMLPAVFLLMLFLMLFGVTQMRVFFLCFGVVAFWNALRIRSILSRDKQCIRSWLVHPVTLRWPMLAFDLWTGGITAVMLFMLL